jgi:hypothetical protein
VGIYLSRDDAISRDDDTFIRGMSVPALASGATKEFESTKIELPDDAGPGSYFLGVFADDLDGVAETAGGTETNNTLALPIQILDVAHDSTIVWRVQLRLKTGTTDNAGTNDNVFVGLTSEEHVEGGGSELEVLENSLTTGSWLDYARNDFERGDDDLYDIRLNNVERLRDITRIQIGKTGTDGWCLASVEVIVNGVRLMAKNYPGNCDYIDPPGGTDHLWIPYATMRGHEDWRSSVLPYPTRITTADIKSMIQSEVGHEIRFAPAYWGHYHGEPIFIRVDPEAKRYGIDLDMAIEVDNFADPDLDVKFALDVVSTCDEVGLKVKNLKVDVDLPLWADVLTLGFLETLDHEIRQALQAELGEKIAAMGKTVALEGFRPVLSLQQDGDLEVTGLVEC